MSTELTPEQREKLEQAVDLARGAGACRYVLNGAPGCVVAQVAVLEGVPLSTLREWDTSTENDAPSVYDRTPELREYPRDLIAALQLEWDGAVADPTDARGRMRGLIAANA